MFSETREKTAASLVHDALANRPLGPYFATPCGILAPLLKQLQERPDYFTVSREDNAVGEASGAALGGMLPVVLMQNSGFGNSVNALASLVAPYRIPMLLIVSMRGVHPDPTPENKGMGDLTEPILDGLGISHRTLHEEKIEHHVAEAFATVEGGDVSALLVRPDLFGWSA